MPRRDYQQLFEQFRQVKVMVVGDVMVDAYLFGKVDRISPEAPVPVVSVDKRVNRLGGAANVALNLKALGAEPVLCSVLGNDQKGKEFMQLLQDEQISGDAIITSPNRITTAKFRVIGNKAQMLRVDEEMTGDLDHADQEALLAKISEIFSTTKIDAIIFQDYNKGVLTTELISEVIAKARRRGIPVAVDPKKHNFFQYKYTDLFKPNLKELREGLGMEINSRKLGDLMVAADRLHDQMNIGTVMITLSDEGVFISHRAVSGKTDRQLVPAHIRNISDVSGAGDTVISVATLCLAFQLDPAEIASLSNLAGGLVCEQVGVVPVDRDKLLSEALKLL